LIEEFGLCPKLCFLQKDEEPCEGVKSQSCKGACEKKEKSHRYNKRVEKAIAWLNEYLPSFAVVDEGKQEGEQSCILMEKGRFYGMGYLPVGTPLDNIELLKSKLVQYPENEYIRGLIYSYLEKKPEKKVVL
jgi:DNA polymerase-3 subunit epsilon